MSSSVIQVRLPDRLIEQVEHQVEKGYFSTKSDLVREAIRRLVIEQQIGTVPAEKESVREVRAIRKNISSQTKDMNVKELKKFFK
jgi:Arc/MetJ-type ribon-helix-helix transcriptional regulator